MYSVSLRTLAIVAAAAGAATVEGHGHVEGIVVNGVWYDGYDPTKYPYMSDPPTVIGWTAGDTDNGFVAPKAYASGDIICHVDATNAGGYATVAAGDKIMLQWSSWPQGHHGPITDYLAHCGADCTTVDKTTLEFFKIDEVGLITESAVPGTWGSDQLIDNGNAWMVQIPSVIAPGNYVLRHEIIALHSAGSSGGAQSYPQCFNLKITGSGTELPGGTLGESLYAETDAGILVNIYAPIASYNIPGPTVMAKAYPITQATSAITATSSATAGNGTAATSAAAISAPARSVTSASASSVAPMNLFSASASASSRAGSSCKRRRRVRSAKT